MAAGVGAHDARLAQLGTVTAELAAAPDFNSVIEIVVSHVADAVSAAVSTLSVLTDDHTLTLVGIRGGQPHTETLWATYPLTANLPACEAVRTGQIVVASGRAELEDRYPLLSGQLPEERSLLCLPLAVSGNPIGVIGLVFAGPWVPNPRELVFLRIFADTCAQAVLRVRAVDEAALRATQLAFLADASAELASSLDYRSTLANVARLAVPRLADWCGVDIVQDGVLQTLAVAHVDPDKVAWARELQQRYPPDMNAHTGVPEVVRTGVSELYSEVTDAMLVAGAVDEEHLRLARDLNLRSVLIVALRARGRVLGAITLVRAETPQRYGPADLAIAEDLGRRAAVAIDNAELHSQTRDVALQLQRAVLPERLDDIPGWDVATYSTAAARSEVGGDFYDALRLPDGRLVVFIGDVMGHGVAAAAAMAQMRAAVRAYIASDPDPSSVVSRLDGMAAMFAISELVTLILLVIDPAEESLAVVNAGHCPPLVVTPRGSAEYVKVPATRPVGAGHDDRTATNWPFPTGSTLLLYTDGLVERRGEDIDASLRRLAKGACGLTTGLLADGLGQLVEAQHEGRWEDDVTALAIRPTQRD
ncbi:MAG: SpoIIE family protein phosphatase [Actinomycetota bacterium]|nr:SpoIIE family protein phosphatase [Actinomycetota bacterium]